MESRRHVIAVQILSHLTWFLSLAGVFVATTLSYSHWAHLSLPCGMAKGGCDRIAQDPRSVVFGVPVAVFGLGAYLVLAVFAARRLLQGFHPEQLWFRVSAALSYAGALISICLVYLSIFVIRSTCLWCMASAMI